MDGATLPGRDGNGVPYSGNGRLQLLDLQDYPGQGSAYVGILDAFMESKGLIAPEEWRHFCSEVVPLFCTEKFCWTNDERSPER